MLHQHRVNIHHVADVPVPQGQRGHHAAEGPVPQGQRVRRAAEGPVPQGQHVHRAAEGPVLHVHHAAEGSVPQGQRVLRSARSAHAPFREVSTHTPFREAVVAPGTRCRFGLRTLPRRTRTGTFAPVSRRLDTFPFAPVPVPVPLALTLGAPRAPPVPVPLAPPPVPLALGAALAPPVPVPLAPPVTLALGISGALDIRVTLARARGSVARARGPVDRARGTVARARSPVARARGFVPALEFCFACAPSTPPAPPPPPPAPRHLPLCRSSFHGRLAYDVEFRCTQARARELAAVYRHNFQFACLGDVAHAATPWRQRPTAAATSESRLEGPPQARPRQSQASPSSCQCEATFW